MKCQFCGGKGGHMPYCSGGIDRFVRSTGEGGAAHQARRVAQARAARPQPVKGKFTKATRNAWKKEI